MMAVDVQTEGSFPRFSACGNFCTGILVGIFTVELADGRTDVTDDEHTVGQTVVLVTSRVGWQTDKSCNRHTDGLVSMTV